jgi:hypothetical protein
MILPVVRSAIVLHTPALGQEYPAGKLKIKRLPSLALPVENLRSCMVLNEVNDKKN